MSPPPKFDWEAACEHIYRFYITNSQTIEEVRQSLQEYWQIPSTQVPAPRTICRYLKKWGYKVEDQEPVTKAVTEATHHLNAGIIYNDTDLVAEIASLRKEGLQSPEMLQRLCSSGWSDLSMSQLTKL